MSNGSAGDAVIGGYARRPARNGEIAAAHLYAQVTSARAGQAVRVVDRAQRLVGKTPLVERCCRSVAAVTGNRQYPGDYHYHDQFDQGISPAAHWARRIVETDDLGDITDDLDEIEAILIDGFGNASGPWNDVVIYGEVEIFPDFWIPVRANLESDGMFHADDGSLTFTWAGLSSGGYVEAPHLRLSQPGPVEPAAGARSRAQR